MKTAILNEEDQKIVEELAGKFGVSEYDIIHESIMLYYKIVKMRYSDRCKVMNLLTIGDAADIKCLANLYWLG